MNRYAQLDWATVSSRGLEGTSSHSRQKKGLNEGLGNRTSAQSNMHAMIILRNGFQKPDSQPDWKKKVGRWTSYI